MTDIINNELAVTLTTQDSITDTSTGQQTYKVVQPVYDAIILHPSLGCPLLLDDGSKSSLELYLAAGTDFFQTYNSGSLADEGGNPVKMVIAAALKVIPWDQNGAILNHPAKAGLLYPDRATNLANIHCHLLGELGNQLKNSQGQHFANLRQSTIDQLRGQMGFSHLYRVTLKDLPMVQNTGLYETFWTVRNEQPETADFHQKYLNSSDRLLRQCFEQNYYKYSKTQKEAPRYAFRVTEGGLSFEADPAKPLLARHPIYVAPAKKKKLSIGHLSDVHISSKQYCYKGKGATVIPEANSEVSPPIGDMANNNGDNFHALLGQMGNKVDLMIITGDLHDHLYNYDPTLLNSDKTGKLWEAMYLTSKDDIASNDEGEGLRADDYPFGIDALAVYSLLINYYDTKQKPLLLTSGNHEAYEFPYGISPRIPLKGKVNPGVPLDHNLTIYEAILLYGPGYESILKGLGNFNRCNFDVFYTIFTPLVDYWQTFGDQCLIGLEWGDGEDFLKSYATGGGDLPRTTESISPEQEHLVEQALSIGASEPIFFSHFTMVNYALDHPLSVTGQIKPDSLSGFDHGSTETGRNILYGRWLKENKFSVALGGHSHRVGLYRCQYVDAYEPFRQNAGNNAYLQMGSSMSSSNVPAHIQTRGYHPVTDESTIQSLSWSGKTKVLVSASTGPIPKQNIEGEMSGQGMEFPSGSMIDENGNISLVTSPVDTAKPRFCVACDYIDILKDGFWDYFKATGDGGTFEMKPHWEKIHPDLSDAAKEKLIEGVTLHLVGGDGTNSIEGTKSKLPDGLIAHTGGASRWAFGNITAKIEFHGESLGAIFLSIKFNDGVLNDLHGFTDYDYTSPWNIQVGIYQKSWFGKKEVDLKKSGSDLSSWEIMRHKKDGEVPSFLARVDLDYIEYDNKLDMPK